MSEKQIGAGNAANQPQGIRGDSRCGHRGRAPGRQARQELHRVLKSLVDPTALTERAFADQERMLGELCSRMSLEELLAFGFERRLGRGQAITLLKKYKG